MRVVCVKIKSSFENSSATKKKSQTRNPEHDAALTQASIARWSAVNYTNSVSKCMVLLGLCELLNELITRRLNWPKACAEGFGLCCLERLALDPAQYCQSFNSDDTEGKFGFLIHRFYRGLTPRHLIPHTNW
jgi:hypothetical protein